MQELTISNLERCFFKASQQNKRFVGVLIEMPGFKKPEVIINPNDNFDNKFAYYREAYDENLNHKHAKGIRIIGFTYGDSFGELERDMI